MTDEADDASVLIIDPQSGSGSSNNAVQLRPVAYGSLAPANTSLNHENLPNNGELVTMLSFDDDESHDIQLHRACINGNYKEVHDMFCKKEVVDINARGKKGNTALHLACSKGHAQIVELLLKHGADVTKRDQNGLNPLDVAVEAEQIDAAMAIVKSDKHWKDALRNYTVDDVGKCNKIRTNLCCCNRGKKSSNYFKRNNANKSDGKHFTTPMRRIIRKMPDVAKVVFDRCCECKTNTPKYDPDYEMTLNYEFLEDFDFNEPRDDYKLQRSYEKWPPPSNYSNENHCLNILANSPSADLLRHPLAASLFKLRWNKYGRISYYINLIIYFLFVILLTSFALTAHPPNSGFCIKVFGSDADIIIKESENKTDAFIDCFSEEKFVPQRSIASIFLIIYSAIMIIREAFQLVSLRIEYLTVFVNYIEVPLFIFTIMFASVSSNQCYCTHLWQWRIGVMAVFLSWIALIFSIRKLPVVGIYVVMFVRIFNNFIKVVVLALLLISAFAFPFFMMFHDPQEKKRTPFITPWRAIFKTVIMTEGEYEMDSILRQNNQRNLSDDDVQYPVITFSLIIVFVILMPILFFNLLISLAVDDTQKIRKSADNYRLFLKVEFVLYIEKFFRKLCCLNCLIVKPIEQKIRPNDSKSKSIWKHFSDIIEKIERSTTTEQVTAADVKNQIKPLSEEVKDLHSSINQLLAIVKSMNERKGGGGGGTTADGRRRGEVTGLEEDEEQQNYA